MIEDYILESHIRLRLMREALSLTKKDFSRILNINYRTYNRYEKKETSPSIKMQQNMIKIGLNPSYLFGEKKITINGNTFENIKKMIINNLSKGIQS